MTGERNDTRPATRRGRVAPVAGVALLSLTVALVAVGAVLLFVGGDFDRTEWGMPGGMALWALGFSAAGYPITRRHPANPVGWLLMVAGVAAGVNLLGLEIWSGTTAGGGGPALLLNAWVVSVVALSSAVVLFPSGSPPSRWWRAHLGVLWSSGVLAYFADWYEEGFVGLLKWLDPIAVPVQVVFQLSLAVGFFSLLARWRRSGAVERLQLKWMMYACVLVGVTALVVELGIARLAPSWYLPGTVVLSILILAIPVAIGVAMLRYRLYDIDVVINRTLVYSILTAMLAAVYVGSVVVLQALFNALTGGESQLAVVVSTLAIAALFNPLRRRVQDFIDRRFYRKKYDAAKTLEAFSAKLRQETDLDALSDELVAVVRETMQPEYVSLWLHPAPAPKSGEGREAGKLSR
jgi:hypothetical protein